MTTPNMTGQVGRQWKPTEVTNLCVEIMSGVYYLRAKVGGKGYRISLVTTDLAVAKQRLDKKMAELRRYPANKRSLKAEARISDPAMWRLFILRTAPELIKQLKRLNKNLERKP
jgi:hypothetical protein